MSMWPAKEVVLVDAHWCSLCGGKRRSHVPVIHFDTRLAVERRSLRRADVYVQLTITRCALLIIFECRIYCVYKSGVLLVFKDEEKRVVTIKCTGVIRECFLFFYFIFFFNLSTQCQREEGLRTRESKAPRYNGHGLLIQRINGIIVSMDSSRYNTIVSCYNCLFVI